MSQTDIDHLEIEMDFAKELISLNEDMVKLFDYPPFKRLILEGYFKEEPVRLVKLKCDAEFRADDKQNLVDRQIFGIGALTQYFERIERGAAMAKEGMDDMENTHEQLLDEAV